MSADDVRRFTADEVIEIANETSDSLGNLYRLDFIDRILHEAEAPRGLCIACQTYGDHAPDCRASEVKFPHTIRVTPLEANDA